MTIDSPNEKQKVVVCVDESPFAVDALKWALKGLLGNREHVEVHLLSVVRPEQQVTEADDSATPWLDPTADKLKRADDVLIKCEQIARSAGMAAVKRQATVAEVGGSDGVGNTIRDYALQQHADTVVVGSRGIGTFTRTFLSGFGLGSVSDYCVRHVPCSVMVHRSQHESTPATHPRPHNVTHIGEEFPFPA